MKQILFVCTGNSCRSVMAEGLFRKLIGAKAKDYAARSAGVSAVDGFTATSETVRVMRNEGIDVSDHQSQRLTPDLIRAVHRIFVMEKMHKDWIVNTVPEAASKVALLTEFSTQGRQKPVEIGIPDPIRMSEEFYRDTLVVIRDCVENIIKSL